MNFIRFESQMLETIKTAIHEKQQIVESFHGSTNGDLMRQSKKYINATNVFQQLMESNDLNKYDDLFKPTLLHYMYQREVKQDMIAVNKLGKQLTKMTQKADFTRYYRPPKQIDGSQCFEIVMTVSGNKDNFQNLLYCSRSVERLGYQVNQLIGSDFSAIIPQSMRRDHMMTFKSMTLEKGVLNKRGEHILPISRLDEFVQPAFIHLKLMPQVEQGVVYFASAMIRELLPGEQIILVDKDGEVLETGVGNEEIIAKGQKLRIRCPSIHRLIQDESDIDRNNSRLIPFELTNKKIQIDSTEVECAISKLPLHDGLYYLIVIKQFQIIATEELARPSSDMIKTSIANRQFSLSPTILKDLEDNKTSQNTKQKVDRPIRKISKFNDDAQMIVNFSQQIKNYINLYSNKSRRIELDINQSQASRTTTNRTELSQIYNLSRFINQDMKIS